MGEARRKREIIATAAVSVDGPEIDAWAWRRQPAQEVDLAAKIDPERVGHMRAHHRDVPNKKGAVSLMGRVVCKDGVTRFRTRVVQPGDLPTDPYLQAYNFHSMNTFWGSRKEDRLAQLNAIYADVDFHTTVEYRHATAEGMMRMLDIRLSDARLPSPSYWMDSGRGLLGVWLIDEVPASAAPLVEAIQQAILGPKQTDDEPRDEREARNRVRIGAVWAGCGLDRDASDLARVFRICGSINEKNGRRVKRLWPESWEAVQRYSLEYLAEEVLPYTRSEIAEMRLARAAEREAIGQERQAQRDRRAEELALYGLDEDMVEEARPARHIGRSAGGTARWQRRVDALMALVPWWGGSVPEGLRNKWAYHVASAWARMDLGDLASWARELSPLCGLSQAELRSYLTSVASRMEAARRGVRVPYRGPNPALQGTLVDPRYEPSAALVRDSLGLSVEDAREACGELLLPKGAGATATERSREWRERQGMERHEAKAAKRLKIGRVALAMRAAGKKWAEIVAAVGAAITTVRKAMTEVAAKIAEGATAVGDAVSNQGEATTDDLRETKHYLVAEPYPCAARRSADPAQSLSSSNVVPFPTPEPLRTSLQPLPDRTLPMPDHPETPPVPVNPWAASVDPVPVGSEAVDAAARSAPLVLPSPPGTLGELSKALLAHPFLGRLVRPGSIVERPGKRERAA